jgi:RecB family endonuclease NucS
MRLVVAHCEVLYTGRLTARLPEAVRLLMSKADGSFLVHDDASGYKPLNRIRSVFRPKRSPSMPLAVAAARHSR